MFQLLIRVVEVLALVWLIRFLWRILVGERSSGQLSGRSFFRRKNAPSQSGQIVGEMKKDPQCGTYVATELSVKSSFRGQEFHFCSRECLEAFLNSHRSV